MPRLRSLHLENLDPLCYNDDPSLLISEATNLETLKLHWSPRIRRERELSVSMAHFFGRVWAQKRGPRFKNIAFANLFSRNDYQLEENMNLEHLQSVTTINCMNGDDPHTIFVDKTWTSRSARATEMKSLKQIRTDKIHEDTAKTLFQMHGLEAMYLVSNREWPTVPAKMSDRSNTTPESTNGEATTPVLAIGSAATNGHASNPGTPISVNPTATPGNEVMSPSSDQQPNLLTKRNIEMASMCIAAITKIHGATLKRLLLFDTWNLGAEAMLGLLSSCPNLEQVGLAADYSNPDFHDFLTKCLRAAPKLWALRVLFPPWSEMAKTVMFVGLDIHAELLSVQTSNPEFGNLRWLGMGPLVHELGEVENGRRKLRAVPWGDERLRAIEIFGLDNGEI
jgi:hypothetical protein